MPAFTEVLNLSICASWLVLAVVLVRFLLKKAPRSFHCGLWVLVAIRLLFPLDLESPLSLIPSREVIPEQYLYYEADEQELPARLDVVTNPNFQQTLEIDTEKTVGDFQLTDLLFSILWYAGMGAMAIYGAYSYIYLRLRVRRAAKFRDNIWECDEIDSPFILGIYKARIYLPSGLDAETARHVLAHEQAHLERHDQLWKPLAFVLLTVHWFNPVMWLAYVLLCRDIELACDERVISALDRHGVCRYSDALVQCSIRRHMIAACPVAFGEVGVKARVKTMLNYKKPSFWLTAMAIVAAAVVAVCFLTDPVTTAPTVEDIREGNGYRIVAEVPQKHRITIVTDTLPKTVDGKSITFEPEEFVVWYGGDSTLWVSQIRHRGNEISFSFDWTHSIGPSGELILPYSLLHEDAPLLEEAELYEYGPDDAFSVSVPSEEYRSPLVTLDFGNLYHITYESDDLPQTLQLAQIRGQNDCRVFDQSARKVTFSLRKDSLPADLFQSDRTYGEEELVLAQLGETTVYVQEAAVREDKYVLACRLSHKLHAGVGEIYLPKAILDVTGRSYADVTGTLLGVDVPHAITMGPVGDNDGFALYLEKAAWDAAGNEVCFQLERFFRIRYVTEGTPTPPDQRYELYIAQGLDTPDRVELVLWADGTGQFHTMLDSNPGDCAYVRTDDALVLTSLEDDRQWHFRPMEHGRYLFDADASSPMEYVNSDNQLVPLSDKTDFTLDIAVQSGQDAAIRNAIFEFHNTGYSHPRTRSISYQLLDTETVGRQQTFHLWTVYQEYDVENGTLVLANAFSGPMTLAFLVEEDAHTLRSMTDDASGFSEQAQLALAEKPDLPAQLEQACADAAQRELEATGGAVAQIINGALDILCAGDESTPHAAIGMHPAEYDEILRLGDNALKFCFEEFARGGQEGLRGEVMALVCQSLISVTEDCAVAEYSTGQDWFDAFAAIARENREALGSGELEKSHPGCHLALKALEANSQ